MAVTLPRYVMVCACVDIDPSNRQHTCEVAATIFPKISYTTKTTNSGAAWLHHCLHTHTHVMFAQYAIKRTRSRHVVFQEGMVALCACARVLLSAFVRGYCMPCKVGLFSPILKQIVPSLFISFPAKAGCGLPGVGIFVSGLILWKLTSILVEN